MTPDLAFAIPGDLATRTGGYEYDRRLIQALQDRGLRVTHLAWPGRYPFPTPADQAQAASSLAALPDGSTVLIDGLAYGALPDLAEAEAARLRLIALVHHPLALESGTPAEQRARLARDEARALSHASAVVVTSDRTKATLVQSFGVPAARIVVALPGTEVQPFARLQTPRHALRLLSVGSLTPRKNHDVLLAALEQLADLPWTCRIVGSPTHAPDEARRIAALRDCSPVRRRVRLEGEVQDAAPFYRRADVFVLASQYEGYGMAFAEALAHGLPVIGTQGGAIPDVVPPSAGILVPPGNLAALAEALRAVIEDPPLRARLANGAARAGAMLPSWADTAERVAALL